MPTPPPRRRSRAPRGRVLLAIALAASALAPLAAGDGDPASDYLLQQDTFTPYPAPSQSAVDALNAAAERVWSHGDRIKIAVIATRQDLGSVTSLYGQPVAYARFLATELEFIYKGPLLVAMPAGYGFARNTQPDPNAQTLLDRLQQPGTDPTTLTNAATTAVDQLSRAGYLHVKDTAKPHLFITTLHALRGRRVLLRYIVSDDSRTARVDLTVASRPGGRVIASFSQSTHQALPGSTHGVIWRVPRTSPSTLYLCGRAADPSGNTSAACGRMTVS